MQAFKSVRLFPSLTQISWDCAYLELQVSIALMANKALLSLSDDLRDFSGEKNHDEWVCVGIPANKQGKK